MGPSGAATSGARGQSGCGGRHVGGRAEVDEPIKWVGTGGRDLSGRGRRPPGARGCTHLAKGPLLLARWLRIFSTMGVFPLRAASSSSWSLPMAHQSAGTRRTEAEPPKIRTGTRQLHWSSACHTRTVFGAITQQLVNYSPPPPADSALATLRAAPSAAATWGSVRFSALVFALPGPFLARHALRSWRQGCQPSVCCCWPPPWPPSCPRSTS